jgi:hypothetical protein
LTTSFASFSLFPLNQLKEAEGDDSLETKSWLCYFEITPMIKVNIMYTLIPGEIHKGLKWPSHFPLCPADKVPLSNNPPLSNGQGAVSEVVGFSALPACGIQKSQSLAPRGTSPSLSLFYKVCHHSPCLLILFQSPTTIWSYVLYLSSQL